jgi:hypothetical protein
MPICYLVPGLAGSTLGYDPGGGRPVWVDYTRLALGQIGAMRLAPDGISPGEPDGVQLYPGDPLPDYYLTCAVALQQQLGPLGYTVRQWGYDWRLSARITGVLLANKIRAEVSIANPCSIVAHSFGGLVARVARAELTQTGDGGLVRKIVTLGTPHEGSYGVVALWSLDNDQLAQVRSLTVLTATLLSAVSPIIAPFPWSRERLVRLTATWPALYETLPMLDVESAQDDPDRVFVYTGVWPADRAISQAWLNYARFPWQTYLRSGVGLTPIRQVTTVAGVGVSTASRMRYPMNLGNGQAYGHDEDGDGEVMMASALVRLSQQVRLFARHADMPNQMGLSGALARLVVAITPDPPTPIPIDVIPGPLNPVLAGPPSPDPRFSDGPC